MEYRKKKLKRENTIPSFLTAAQPSWIILLATFSKLLLIVTNIFKDNMFQEIISLPGILYFFYEYMYIYWLK